MKEDNKKIYIIIICIMGAIILFLGGYLIFDKVILKEHNNIKNKAENIINKIEDKIEEKLDEEEEINNTNNHNNNIDQNKKYCEGTYYGKADLGNNGSTESEYKLNNDGTYTVNHNNLHEIKGYYVITDNTITFIEPREVLNSGEVNNYNSVSMYIDKDCNYFIGNVNNTDVKYEKK